MEYTTTNLGINTVTISLGNDIMSQIRELINTVIDEREKIKEMEEELKQLSLKTSRKNC